MTRLDDALAAIDQANAEDPNTLTLGGKTRPKAQAEGELVSAWIGRLVADPSEELLLAARAHHVRRWTSPRSSYPDGRAGYLRWRRDLHEFHAAEVARLLGDQGYDPASIARVQDLVRKRDLRAGTDPEVQALEDAICLTFLEAEFVELADKLEADHMVDVLVKTLAKMSEAGKQAALGIELAPREAGLLSDALRQAAE